MTTIQQPKALTVKQYEFYKRKGMTDDKVMKQHGMHSAGLNAWKKANNLIGVKFEADVKVTKSNEMGNVQSVDSKPAPPIDKNDLQPLRPSVTPEEIQILSEQVKSGTSDSTHDLEDADNTVNLKDAEIEELKKQIIWLEERHAKDTARIDESNAKRYDEIARADMWREKCRITEMELRDKGCEIEKLKEQHYIEARNLRDELRMVNSALVKHAQDEQLLFQVMKKMVTVSDRLNETVEGEVANKWR